MIPRTLIDDGGCAFWREAGLLEHPSQVDD
jgi:hypothetical protein